MKTSTNNFRTPQSTISLFIFWTLILSMLFITHVNGQHTYQGNTHDPDFPGRKRFNAGVMTTYTSITPPPAIIGDVTYGISRNFFVGIIVGTTGAQSLAGLKINSMLFQRNNFRVVYRIAIIYYPGRDGQYLLTTATNLLCPGCYRWER